MLHTVLQWFENSPAVKLLAILIIVLLLLIPANDIQNIISERESFQYGAIADISGKWGEEQTFSGPVLSVPYSVVMDKGKTTAYTAVQHLHLLPEKLNINGEVSPQVRKRGIYKALLYSSELNFEGTLLTDAIADAIPEASEIHYNDARISFGVSDPKGIKSAIEIEVNGTKYRVEPGSPEYVKFSNGFSVKVPLMQDQPLAFSGNIKLNGSASLYFVPLARETAVNIRSAWPSPSFNGSFLPETHTVEKEGFDATWKVYDFNRSIPQIWKEQWFDAGSSSFGFSMIEEVNVYQKTMRSAKYAFMIIALTFTFFFFFETIKKMKIHPIQYSIVGIAICVFYTLLLALSEHISFGMAYLVSALAIISITTFYFYHLSKSRAATLLFGSVFTSLYVFIYTILNLESHALLVGSIGIFVALALVMYYTRNIDWYKPGKQASGSESDASGFGVPPAP